MNNIYYKRMNFYYDLKNNEARVFDLTTNEYKTMTLSEVYSLKKRYYAIGLDDISDEGLKGFANDFINWVEDLQEDEEFNFNYKKYNSHEEVAIVFFKKLCRPKNKRQAYTFYENHDDIDCVEYKWIEACENSGLIYCESGVYECYGYDFSSQFPAILASKGFRIPTKRGKEQTIKEIPIKNMQVGFYKVKITSNDKRFDKIFMFSEKNVYTNISLVFAMMCKKKYNYDIDIELIQEENNCYLYGNNTLQDITFGSNIFGYWNKVIMGLKGRHPKNKLIKHMSSALWGRFAQHNRIFKTLKECEDEGIDYYDDYSLKHEYYIRDSKFNKKGEEVLELVNCKKPYKYSIARIKPFLLSKSRELTGKIAREYIDDVVRIHTDNVTFNKEHDDVMTKTEQGFKLTKEKKTTGKIHFVRANCYKNYTNEKYTTKNYHYYENDEITNE